MRKQTPGEVLTELRERRGLSRSQLSRDYGIAYMTLHRLENGEDHNVKIQTIGKVLWALGAPKHVARDVLASLAGLG